MARVSIDDRDNSHYFPCLPRRDCLIVVRFVRRKRRMSEKANVLISVSNCVVVVVFSTACAMET